MDPPSSAPRSVAPTRPGAPPWLPSWLTPPAEFPARRLVAGAGVVAAVAVVAVVAFAFLRPPAAAAPQFTLPRAGAEGTDPAGPTAAGGATSPTSAMLTVHVAGAVVSPGVYAVAAGARVADALTAAGGPLPEGDVDRLNLAAHVADGDRVFVARKGDDPADGGTSAGPGAGTAAAGGSGAGGPASAGPLDLNSATAEQLDTLPGVGPATAQAIITYRTRHGRFRSVTELLDVPGIGPAKLEAVRPLVKV